MPDPAEFEICTEIEIVSGRIGVYGWPWELQHEYSASPGVYSIRFTGHALDRIESEKDYYRVEIRKKA